MPRLQANPLYDEPVKINMDPEEALILLLLLDPRRKKPVTIVCSPDPYLRTLQIERLIDNCDGDPDVLWQKWNELWDGIESGACRFKPDERS